MSDTKTYIRPVSITDAEELLAIYAPYVENTAVTFEYDVPSAEEFTERIRSTLTRYPYLAAVEDGKITGYAYAGAFKSRSAYDWSAEVSIYVKKGHHGQGIGRMLYAALEDRLRRQNIVNLYACIASTETEDGSLTRDSIRFHERMGYRLVGEFRKCGCKFGRWYDMVWMEKWIGVHKPHPPQIIPFCALS
ncbi:MAG: N-acetyltransferase [Ruminococcus sp.]|nr:N-acetyltransferase [Ruminococcus sp.]